MSVFKSYLWWAAASIAFAALLACTADPSRNMALWAIAFVVALWLMQRAVRMTAMAYIVVAQDATMEVLLTAGVIDRGKLKAAAAINLAKIYAAKKS